jgi:hypothetical protein
MSQKIGVLPTWTLEESMLDLIAHGHVDLEVVVR